MSSSDGDDSGPGRREVAHRVFAAEFDDADLSYSESDEERAPNYVVTPSGARVNRLFLVGVLTETEWVNDDMLRARVVDPTGPFVTYAGQYQPEALGFLERTEPPAFLAVTGKARTFEPEDGDRVFTSVRPESISEVDGDTRDRWAVEAAKRTIDRVEAMAAAMGTGLGGDELVAALEADGVDHATASGIALALDHYGTTPAYLGALRDLAEDTLRMVAGELDEVGKLTVAPDEGDGAVSALTDRELSVDAAATADESSTTASAERTDSAADDSFEPPSEGTTAERAVSEEAASTGSSDDPAEAEATAPESTTATDTTAGEPEEPDPVTEPDTEPEPTTQTDPTADDTAAVDSTDDTDELGDFETDVETEVEDEVEEELGDFDPEEDDALTEAERAEVEAEFDTGFSTGNEVEPEPELEPDAEPSGEEVEPSDDGSEASDDAEPASEGVGAEPEPKPEATAEGESEPDADVPLDEAVMDAMAELDDGDGADRSELVAAVTERTGASAEEVDEAIEDALMSGQCYEPSDGVLKPI